MKIYRAIVCVMILLLAVSLGGCGRDDEDVLRIAFFPNITHSQALVMKDQGTLEARLGDSFGVEWMDFNAGPAEVEAMFAGEIDLGYIGPVPAINANVKSFGDFQIIAGATDGGAVLVTREGFEMKDITDLDEKIVAIPQLGNTQHLTLVHLLTEANLVPVSEGGTVDVVASSNADIFSLIGQQNADAALVPEPWGSTILQQTEANLAMDYDEVWRGGDYSTAVILVSKDFLEDHEDIVKIFLEEHKKITAYINENQAEAREIVNRQLDELTGKTLAPEVLEEAFTRMIITEQISEESIWEFAELMQEQRFIRELPDESLINDVLLNSLE